ncbi:pentatricopeptide repeat-containing protein At3g42630 isoform X2 [Impatiens glandulifera]|nr:pentatricopeptide repeat-containing protein At3g42630 isoform X2 [Impatiens glandulifera]
MTALMLNYLNNGFLTEAKSIWDTILNSSHTPSVYLITELINVYGRMKHFNEVTEIVQQITSRGFDFSPQIYKVAICCLGKEGQLDLMEKTLREMVSKGFMVDSETWNSYVVYYSCFGSLKEMEAAYCCLKKSRILIEEEAIRAMSFSYLKARKFYRLGEYLKDIGLGRRNVGNLLWNLLLLSYAANFKMKSLQREFLNMIGSGFYPDITTFNIRALAFSKMGLFWDLHLSIDHMKHEGVVPDLVTYGCIIDAYLDRRMGRNLDFCLGKMNTKDSVQVRMDSYVFEVMGMGDFHSTAELFLEFRKWNDWSYEDLVSVYLKKKYRSNQIFWNY